MSQFIPGQIVRTTIPKGGKTMPDHDKGIVPGLKVRLTRTRRNGLVYAEWLEGPLKGEEFGPWGEEWFADHGDVKAKDVAIDFSIDRYAKARDYAAQVPSRVLDDKTNKVFRSISRGEQVKALDILRALPLAFSAAATRFGQSPARRQAVKELRHIAYIVNATLENVIEGLPPVEPGARSPRLAELEAEVERLSAALKDVPWSVVPEARRDDKGAEQIDVATQVAAAKAEVDEQVKVAKAALRDAQDAKVTGDLLRKNLAASEAERDDLAKELAEERAVLNYILHDLGLHIDGQVKAFRNGYLTGRNDG